MSSEYKRRAAVLRAVATNPGLTADQITVKVADDLEQQGRRLTSQGGGALPILKDLRRRGRVAAEWRGGWHTTTWTIIQSEAIVS